MRAPALDARRTRAAHTQLVAHLLRFRLRARVDVADASAHWAVWARVPTLPPSSPLPLLLPEPSAEEALAGWRRDPRLAVRPPSNVPSFLSFVLSPFVLSCASTLSRPPLPTHPQALGWRAVLPRAAPPPRSGADIDAADDAVYDAHRLSLGVAEGASELAGELPLELNLDALGAISFTKGCYLGQELTSRTHFRGVIRKRAAPFSYNCDGNDADVCRGDVVAAPADGGAAGAAVGRVLAARRGRGVALLRLAAVPALAAAEGKAAAATTTLVAERAAADGQPARARVALAVTRPGWWPPSWGAEA
jgi:folate-binding protein YgfZ